MTRYLPGLAVLSRYDRSWLRYDLLAGVSVAAVAVPIAIAYSQLAGVPPAHGAGRAHTAGDLDRVLDAEGYPVERSFGGRPLRQHLDYGVDRRVHTLDLLQVRATQLPGRDLSFPHKAGHRYCRTG